MPRMMSPASWRARQRALRVLRSGTSRLLDSRRQARRLPSLSVRVPDRSARRARHAVALLSDGGGVAVRTRRRRSRSSKGPPPVARLDDPEGLDARESLPPLRRSPEPADVVRRAQRLGARDELRAACVDGVRTRTCAVRARADAVPRAVVLAGRQDDSRRRGWRWSRRRGRTSRRCWRYRAAKVFASWAAYHGDGVEAVRASAGLPAPCSQSRPRASARARSAARSRAAASRRFGRAICCSCTTPTLPVLASGRVVIYETHEATGRLRRSRRDRRLRRRRRAFDIIIRHGTVIDGSGNPRYDADIGIRNGFIVAIGDLDAPRRPRRDRRARAVRHARLHQHSQPRVARRAADRRQHADAGRDHRDLQRRRQRAARTSRSRWSTLGGAPGSPSTSAATSASTRCGRTWSATPIGGRHPTRSSACAR